MHLGPMGHGKEHPLRLLSYEERRYGNWWAHVQGLASCSLCGLGEGGRWCDKVAANLSQIKPQMVWSFLFFFKPERLNALVASVLLASAQLHPLCRWLGSPVLSSRRFGSRRASSPCDPLARPRTWMRRGLSATRSPKVQAKGSQGPFWWTVLEPIVGFFLGRSSRAAGLISTCLVCAFLLFPCVCG